LAGKLEGKRKLGKLRWRREDNTEHTQKNGAVLIVNTIKTAPFFCVCPVLKLIFKEYDRDLDWIVLA
jgi:hypothetical protein